MLFLPFLLCLLHFLFHIFYFTDLLNSNLEKEIEHLRFTGHQAVLMKMSVSTLCWSCSFTQTCSKCTKTYPCTVSVCKEKFCIFHGGTLVRVSGKKERREGRKEGKKEEGGRKEGKEGNEWGRKKRGGRKGRKGKKEKEQKGKKRRFCEHCGPLMLSIPSVPLKSALALLLFTADRRHHFLNKV